MKFLITVVIALAMSQTTHAQLDDARISKQQFLDMIGSALARTDLSKKKPATDAELASKKKRSERMSACLGISEAELEKTESSATPEMIYGLMTQCSEKLPEMISLKNFDFANNPDFAEFNSCTESAAAETAGISLKKYQKCQAEQATLE